LTDQSKNGAPIPEQPSEGMSLEPPLAPGHIAIAVHALPDARPAQGSKELAQMATALFAAIRRGPAPQPGWVPYADGDSNIPITKSDGSSTPLGDVLAEALAPIGYTRVDKLTYRADWSPPDVEQVLWFDTYGNPKEFLVGDAGLRNANAEAFAKQCQQRYASPLILQCLGQESGKQSSWFCAVHFSVGSLFRWGLRSSLSLAGCTAEQITTLLAQGVRSKLLPLIGDIRTIARLLDFLERDGEPLPWLTSGTYYRAALVAYLAAKVGRPPKETKNLLMQHAAFFANGIDTARLTPESYVDHILADAEAAIAGEAARG
jgi:hypothetical protein